MDAQQVIDQVPHQLLVGGQWVSATGESTFNVSNPATGEVLCAVANATPEDGMRALDAAVDAQESFAQMPALQRHNILMRAFELLHERKDDLALLMTLEMGKPLADSAGEITYAAEFFRHFAGEALRIDGGYQTSPQGGARFIVSRQPVGPSILITPWNFPMAMGTRKIGPAIAAGCTSVIKPAQQTPLSMLALGQILLEAGAPEGVVNVITSEKSGSVMEPMIRSGKARKLSFTGSTGVGKILLEQCASTVMRTSMELGGNAPFIVFDDADMDEAVAGCIQAKMRNMGEACTAANRIYVHESIIDEFGKRLAEQMQQMPVGDGTQEGVKVGPLIDKDAQDKVNSLVQDALDQGAQTVTGGQRPDGSGYFYPPTVLTGVPQSARMASEEIFGPVAPLTAFSAEDEVLKLANDTPYGLVSYVYTNDLRRSLRMGERLEAGMVGINQGVVSNPYAPFGGIKESGLGREGGLTGIDEFLETKYIGVAAH